MPDEIDLGKMRVALRARLANLETLAAANAENRATVALDQQSVVRLSRIDAGEFEWCAKCREAVGERRLALDPTIALCIDCAR